MHSHQPFQFSVKLSGGLLLLALFAFACWVLAAPTRLPLRARLIRPEVIRIGAPLLLEVVVSAPFPLRHLRPVLSPGLNSGLLWAHQHQAEFHGFSLRGPLWLQRYALIPVSPHPLPAAAISLPPLTVDLPALQPIPPAALPDAPVLQPAPESSTSPFLALIPLAVLMALTAGIAYRRRQPKYRIQRLKPTPKSLDLLPELLAKAQLKRQSQPDFYHRLDQARFAPVPPTRRQIEELLLQATELLRQH